MRKQDCIEIIARGLLIEDGHLLICRNRKAGYGFLPGGHVEFGESAEAALRRELIEECGLEVRTGDCLLVSEGAFESGGRRHHEINLVFHVERKEDGAARPTVESVESKIGFEWIKLGNLAQADIRPAVVCDWLLSIAKGQIHPGTTWIPAIHS